MGDRRYVVLSQEAASRYTVLAGGRLLDAAKLSESQLDEWLRTIKQAGWKLLSDMPTATTPGRILILTRE